MRAWLVLVLMVGAGCSGKHKAAPPPVKNDASTRVEVVIKDLPQVGGEVAVAPATDPIPENVILLDENGNFARVDGPKQWSALVLHQRTSSPGTIEDLDELSNNVHAKMQDDDDARITEEVSRYDEEHPIEPGTIVEPPARHMGQYLYAERPRISAIDSLGDGVPVVDGVPVRVPRMPAAIDDKNPSEPFLFVAAPAARAHRLVDGLSAVNGGMIGVSTQQGPRALPWRF